MSEQYPTPSRRRAIPVPPATQPALPAAQPASKTAAKGCVECGATSSEDADKCNGACTIPGDPAFNPQHPKNHASKTAAEAAAELIPGLPQWERRGHWGAVIESVEQVDPPALYRELVAALRLGEAATDYGTVHRALDNAEHNAFRAGQLARAAKLEQERVDRACDQELEVLRTRARKELEQESAAARGNKGPGKITIQEVEDRMMAAGTGWPELVSRLKRRKEEAHAQRGTCEHLEESWRSRCNTLRVMATKLRPIEVAEGVT